MGIGSLKWGVIRDNSADVVRELVDDSVEKMKGTAAGAEFLRGQGRPEGDFGEGDDICCDDVEDLKLALTVEGADELAYSVAVIQIQVRFILGFNWSLRTAGVGFERYDAVWKMILDKSRFFPDALMAADWVSVCRTAEQRKYVFDQAVREGVPVRRRFFRRWVCGCCGDEGSGDEEIAVIRESMRFVGFTPPSTFWISCGAECDALQYKKRLLRVKALIG